MGELEKLAGVKTVYMYPMDGTGSIGRAFGVSAPLSLWSAVFQPLESGASVVGEISEGLTPGLAFVTEHRHGLGKIVMLGSMPSGEEGDAMLRQLIRHYADEAGVTVRSDVTPGTLVAPRCGASGQTVWFIVNMDGRGGSVTLPCQGTDALTGDEFPPGQVAVEPFGYKAIRLNLPLF